MTRIQNSELVGGDGEKNSGDKSALGATIVDKMWVFFLSKVKSKSEKFEEGYRGGGIVRR